MSLEEKTNPQPPVLWEAQVGPVENVQGQLRPACVAAPVQLGRVQSITVEQARRFASELEDPLLAGAVLCYLRDLDMEIDQLVRFWYPPPPERLLTQD